jgi:hypothetical protein
MVEHIDPVLQEAGDVDAGDPGVDIQATRFVSRQFFPTRMVQAAILEWAPLQYKRFLRLEGQERVMVIYGVSRHMHYARKVFGKIEVDDTAVREIIDDAKLGRSVADENEKRNKEPQEEGYDVGLNEGIFATTVRTGQRRRNSYNSE